MIDGSSPALRDELAQMMVDWLERLDDNDSPYVDGDDLDDVCIDGRVNMRHMADAILEAFIVSQRPNA